jgi:TatD DNase family protein
MYIHTHVASATIGNVVTLQAYEPIPAQLFTCGLHPWYLQNASNDFLMLQKIAMQENCIAIGECGLDKLCATDWQLQIESFTKQIQLANAIQKPLVIHCVRASSEVISLLKKEKNTVPIIIHGFSQNAAILKMYLQENFYISIGGAVANNKSNAHALVANIPTEKLLLETDEDENLQIQEVYAKVAQIKNISIHELENQITKNFNTIFTNNKL